jgi:selenide,water dikinase
MVGLSDADDAAVSMLDSRTALIASADLFTPIVDDAYDYGRIAAANAFSDIYAMGGHPALAMGLLGWPVETVSTLSAKAILCGAIDTCRQAGATYAGGHTFDTLEPLFGLSVNGFAEPNSVCRNRTARPGDWVFLTKSIGTGVISTALKKGISRDSDLNASVVSMTTLNRIGPHLAESGLANAMTDVTGFGLAGHILEMARPTGLSMELDLNCVSLLPGVTDYWAASCEPDGAMRNRASFAKYVRGSGGQNPALYDPQTNGGLLISSSENNVEKIKSIFELFGLEEHVNPIGTFNKLGERSEIITHL